MQDEFVGTGLIDGSAPLTPVELIAMLESEGIDHHTLEHPPMRTVEDAKALRAPSEYGHTKNLFVRDRKANMWLLTLHEDRRVDMKSTAQLVGTNRFSFASAERLFHYLGVTPGAVSAFSILNDVTRRVSFFIDEALMDAPALHIHPLVNTMTTTIAREELFSFLERRGYAPQVLRFPD